MEKIKVYYEDTDASGRVFYANYLKYLERGRTEFLYKLNLNHKYIKDNFDIIFVVKKCDIDFVKPGFFEDIINVETKILSFSKVKIIFKQNLLINKEIIVKAKITIVSINSSGKIKSMPKKLLNYFN